LHPPSLNIVCPVLNECRFEEEVVLGKPGKTKTVKVYERFLSHEEFLADSSACRAELKSVSAPSAVDQKALNRSPVDYGIVVRGVVVRS